MTQPTTNLRPLSPYQDWQAKQPIFWGTTNSPTTPQIDATIASKIRTEAIAANFQTKEPKVITLQPVAAHTREKLSLLSIFYSSIQGVYREGRMLQNVALITMLFASALMTAPIILIGTVTLSASLYVTLVPQTKINDFVKIVFFPAVALTGVLIGFFLVFLYEKFLKGDPHSLFGIFEKLKHMNEDSHALVQNIQQLPSSVGDTDLATLANDKDGDGWRDPLSFELIPKEEICAPYYLLIGKYVTRVENVLKVIFNHFDETDHRIRHPIENRFMTQEEHKKFLKDICALFSFTETEFLSLWNNNPIIEIPNSLLSQTNDMRIMFRTCNFLNLIPEEIKNHHLKTIPRKDQIDLLARTFILVSKPNKWSFYPPDNWIALPFRDGADPKSICQLVHPGSVLNEFAFPPAILLSKHLMIQSLEEFKAKFISQETAEDRKTMIELGRFSPSSEEGVLLECINSDQTQSYHFLIFKESCAFRLTTIAHQNDFHTFSNIFKQVICSFRLGDDTTPVTPEKLAQFEQLISRR
jgi:hypothetical protein